MEHWYACRVHYDWELDDGEGYWYREDTRYAVLRARDAEEAGKIAGKSQKPRGWGWYVTDTYAEECGSEEAAWEKVRSWQSRY